MNDQMLPISFNKNNAKLIWHRQKKKTCRPVKETDTRCRYGSVGDLLWVSEPFYASLKEGYNLEDADITTGKGIDITYLATGGLLISADKNNVFTSVHSEAKYMPRWASRMTIKITGLCITNLHDVDEDEIIRKDSHQTSICGAGWYSKEWESCYGVGSWEPNPLIWEMDFELT